jgi:RimJ/RimL family protein N-acetyltransferase
LNRQDTMTIKRRKNKVLAGLKSAKGKFISGQKVRLRQKKLTDVRNDYAWQSDPELARLDAAPVLKASFPVYLMDYVEIIHKPERNRFPLAIETMEGKHIGNCTCYDIDESKSEAQIGIMIGERDYWDKGYGADAINTLVDHIFMATLLNRVYLKTLDWNLRAQKCFRNCGFIRYATVTRNGHNFLYMELTREKWLKKRKKGEASLKQAKTHE